MTEDVPGPAETGDWPGGSRPLPWTLITAAVLLPTAAGGLLGFVLAVTSLRHRGAELALPEWLYPATWGTGITALALALVLTAWLWVGKPWRAAGDDGSVRLVITSLAVVGLLCCLASVAVPS